MSAPSDEREQLRRVLLRVWRSTEPRSAARRSRRLAAAAWRRHLEHRSRPGAVDGTAVRAPVDPAFGGLGGLDALGDAIAAEHAARQALCAWALGIAYGAAGHGQPWHREVVRLENVAALRAVAAVSLRLLRELGSEVGEYRLQELVERVLAEGHPDAEDAV